MSNSKLIRIPSRGRVITDRGYIPTPIRIPYRETIDNIFRMLSTTPTPTIIECLPDGSTVELNAQNFDKDNTIVRPEINPASIIPSVNNVEQKTDDPAQTPVEGGETETQGTPSQNNDNESINQDTEQKTDDEVNTPSENTEETQGDNNVEQKKDDPAQTPVEGGETEVQTQPIVNTNKKNKNKNKNKQQGSSENITVDPEKVE